MQKIVILSLLALSFSALLVPAAEAFTCSDAPTLEAGGVYVDARRVPSAAAPLDYSVWLFAESGAAPGLQRGGSHAALTALGQQSLAGQIGETDIECPASGLSDLILL